MASFEWDARLDEFILFGVETNEEDENVGIDSADEDSVTERLKRLRNLQNRAQDLQASFQQELKAKLEISSSLLERNESIDTMIQRVEGSGLSQMMERYLRLRLKIGLMSLATAMSRLEGFSSADEIPAIISAIQSCRPPAMFRKMKLFEMVRLAVANTRAVLLNKFLKAFEDHLSEESRPWGGSDVAQGAVWVVFLKQARSWLLAYSLVSVLPASLMDSQQAVLEAFQMAIDEAFMPLWGRFYHHLKQGREGSAQQVFWTFSFAKSFLQMLLSLCAHITSADQLKSLCNVDYAKAGKEQIVDKAVRFLRAHLAMVLVDGDQADDAFSSRIMEDTFDLDDWLYSYRPPMTLSSVIYDAKPCFHRLLWTEQRDMVQQLRKCCDANAFDNMFDVEADMAAGHSLFCYASIYHSMCLLQSYRSRYAFLPPAAQNVLSEVLLEPVLCFSLGLLLYKIRSDSVLFNISIGQQQRIDRQLGEERLQEFTQCVTYFQTALGNSNDSLPFAASSSRCKRRWGIVQSWMPKILITATQCAQGFSLTDLSKTALKTSDRFSSLTFDYRIKDQLGMEEGERLEDCLLLIRGLSITLVDVLRQQLDA